MLKNDLPKKQRRWFAIIAVIILPVLLLVSEVITYFLIKAFIPQAFEIKSVIYIFPATYFLLWGLCTVTAYLALKAKTYNHIIKRTE